jgi:superfamily II DNA/RNA helicase
LCSATFPPEVQRVASDFLKPDYYFVAAGRVGGMHDRISQRLIWADGGPAERHKLTVAEVNNFLSRHKGGGGMARVIVFCNTKDEVERIGSADIRGTVRVVTGDKLQAQRNKYLQEFRDGKVQVLIATDVAAR